MGRVLALDLGARRTGVAVSDPLRITARPLTVLDSDEALPLVAEVARLVLETAAEIVVVGLPVLPSGDLGDQARDVAAFVALLEPAIGIPVVLWDEAYSTVEAQERRLERGGRSRAARRAVDAEAAAVILESWLHAGEGSRGASGVNGDPWPPP